MNNYVILFLMCLCVCTDSGGVMIYFDRVEVVNVLSASAGSVLQHVSLNKFTYLFAYLLREVNC